MATNIVVKPEEILIMYVFGVGIAIIGTRRKTIVVELLNVINCILASINADARFGSPLLNDL